MRKIIFYLLLNGKSPVEDFLESLSNKQVEKIFFVLDLIETTKTVPRKFFKKLESTDNIWEVRARYGNSTFRLLGFFDGSNLIVLNHAFTKKTQKIPKKEIKIAEQRKKNYFTQKRLL